MARLGALTQAVFAALIAAVSFAATGGNREPDFLPRPLVLFEVYGLVAAIAWIGIARGRPGVVLAASAAAWLGSIIGFSGVTLIFLCPASLLGVGALRMRSPDSARPVGATVGSGALAVIVLSLSLGSGWAALFVTDAACWTVREVPGGVEIEPTAYTTGPIEIPVDAPFNAVNCATGLISARGVGGAAVLGALAVAVASRPSRRRATNAGPTATPA